MEDFLGNNAKIYVEAKIGNDSCCPELDLKTRLIGFCISIIISFFLYSMSLATILGAITGSSTFIIIYTCANISFILSTFFLCGPKKQWKNMLEPVRITSSLFFFGALILTIISQLFFNSWIISVICIAVQFSALTWYILSYIPYGRDTVWGCLKNCCCGDSESK